LASLRSFGFSGVGLRSGTRRHRLLAVTSRFHWRAGKARTACGDVVALAVFLLVGICIATAHAQVPSVRRTAPADPNAWLAEQSELCAGAVQQAEQQYHLPHGLLTAIAKAESGRPITSLGDVRPWPWTIDADGTGLFLDSKPAAIAWVRSQSPRHSFIDVGCMQVDLKYHPNAFASLEQAFDPVANANYAAQLLLGLYQGEAGGSWDLAVGLYHSHTPWLAAVYRDRVAMIGSDIEHGTLTEVPLYVRAIRQGTLRLPLTGGRVTVIHVHRQPALRNRHSYTVCQIEKILGPYLSGGQRAAACAAATHEPTHLASTPPETK
jgi:hypothetical protein